MEGLLQWLLLGLPVAFVLGWVASRLDLRQQRLSKPDAQRAYVKGLNLLLNEQHDHAIDAFIEAVQADPETAELHFALGNLFRRRGEFERAVRVHEHLLQRGDLNARDRARAQHALAQDYMKAGLFDRAEAACKALMGTAFEAEAQANLLSLHERARDWQAAATLAQALSTQAAQQADAAWATRAAHHWCEFALEAQGRKDCDAALKALERARALAPEAPRPALEAGGFHWRQGQARQAFAAWVPLAQTHPAHLALVASDLAAAALQAGEADTARTLLTTLQAREPDSRWQQALDVLQGGQVDTAAWTALLAHPAQALDAAQALLALPATNWPADTQGRLQAAAARAAEPLQRHRCAACGFEARQYYWQCPGCLNWDSYPTQRLGAL